jgi:cytidine kinase
MSLIVTGSIGIDTIHAPAGIAENVLGGSCIYFAAAASFFGPVRLVGAVGEDFPEAFLGTFQKFNIDLAGLERRAGSKTFRWTGKYHDNVNVRDTLSVELNVLIERLPEVPVSYQDSQYVFLANTHPGAQMELLSRFPHRKLVVADTMDLWIINEQVLLKKLLAQVDGLVLNDSEAGLLTGESNIVKAAGEILKLGPKFVVIKKGEHGCMIRHRDGVVSLPAYPAENVIDPTGAGDSFAGGMMGYLTQTGDLSLGNIRKAMAYGTAIASYNLEAFSLGKLEQISRKDVDSRFKQYAGMLKVE